MIIVIKIETRNLFNRPSKTLSFTLRIVTSSSTEPRCLCCKFSCFEIVLSYCWEREVRALLKEFTLKHLCSWIYLIYQPSQIYFVNMYLEVRIQQLALLLSKTKWGFSRFITTKVGRGTGIHLVCHLLYHDGLPRWRLTGWILSAVTICNRINLMLKFSIWNYFYEKLCCLGLSIFLTFPEASNTLLLDLKLNPPTKFRYLFLRRPDSF